MSKKIQEKTAVEKNNSAAFSLKTFNANPLVSTYLPVIVFALVTFVLRWRLLDIPLERDEGGFAYMGYTWLNGTPLFSDYVDVKPPMIYILYGIFEGLFGATPKGIHTGLFIFNLGFTITFYFYIKKKFSFGTAVISSLVFIFLSALPNVFGFAAHATQLLLWPAIAGIWLTDYSLEKSKIHYLVPAGFLLGMAFLVKQQAIGFMLLAGFYLTYLTLIKDKNWKRWLFTGSILTISALSPYLICIIWFYFSGNLNNFWYWTYVWPAQFAATQTGNIDVFKMMYNMVTNNIEIFWYLGLSGVILSCLDQWSAENKVFTVLLAIFGFISLSVGFHYYPHYFVVLLPAISLGVGLAFHFTYRILSRFTQNTIFTYPAMIFAFILLFYKQYTPQKNYFTKTKKADIVRQVYGTNPFQESYILGNKIKSMSKSGDSILVLGSEPELLFYAKLPTISQHMHYYQLVDGGPQNDSLQTELITKVEKSKPRFLVFARSGFSWLVKDPNNQLFQWVNKLFQSYNLKGVINIYKNNPSEYYWDAEATQDKVGSEDVLFFFELKQ
jgi:4-amino-4-deoxy-L-arabinose transferase-like glycosyltransferase